jgi:hypothetical protein
MHLEKNFIATLLEYLRTIRHIIKVLLTCP